MTTIKTLLAALVLTTGGAFSQSYTDYEKQQAAQAKEDHKEFLSYDPDVRQAAFALARANGESGVSLDEIRLMNEKMKPHEYVDDDQGRGRRRD